MRALDDRRVCGSRAARFVSNWVALGVVVLLAAPALAGSVGAPTGGSPVAVQVLESGDRIVLDYSIGGYLSSPVEINGQRYEEIKLVSEPVLQETGAPALPRVCRSVIIPDEAEMAVKVLAADYYEVLASVAPSKGIFDRTIDPESVPYTFGPAYKTNAFFPGPLVQLSEPYILRSYRGTVVELYPFQYNPVTRVLRVYTHFTVAVEAVGTSQTNVLNPVLGIPRPSLAFQEVYQRHFLNYNWIVGLYPPMDEEGDMLVICYDSWMSNMQPFVDHKNSIGIPTTIVGVSTIGNNSTAIKNYIQNIYNTTDLAFVLLVGDSTQVATPTASGGSSDPSYSKLAGNDNWPDIMVGRFSAESADQVNTQVQRTVEYELMPAVEQAWFWKGVGIGSAQGSGIGDEGQADYVHIGQIRGWLMNIGYTLVDEIYDPNATAAMVTNALNNGRGIINYCGHGSTTSWGTTGFSNSNVTALLNDNMLPFIFSVACVNGQFAGYTCFAEAWLRSTHNGEPIGAVGTYMSSINQSWATPMEAQDEFNLLYCAGTYHSYGTLCYAGSCSMMEDYGSDGVDMFNTWHIFGDPSLRIVGTVARGMSVTPSTTLAAQGPRGGPFTPDSIQYTVQNLREEPIDYQVTNTQPWVTIANGSGTVAAQGSAVVTVSVNAGANLLNNGDFTDTVSFANLTTHEGDTARSVALHVGVVAAQYVCDLSTDPGWTVEAQWAYGHPTGGGSHGRDPSNGHTGANVYGYNLSGDYTNNMSTPVYLTTTAIDCTYLASTELRFWRWLGVESYDRATVDVSNNGVNWVNLWTNSGTLSDTNWVQRSYNIAAVADGHATVYVRWGVGPTDAGVTYPGWNVDDVEIWGLDNSPMFAPGDLNCDGAVNNFDISAFVLALTSTPPDYSEYYSVYAGCDHDLADVNGDGNVDNFDISPFVALLTGG